jgi:hypothetical protein
MTSAIFSSLFWKASITTSGTSKMKRRNCVAMDDCKSWKATLCAPNDNVDMKANSKKTREKRIAK